MGKVIQIEIPEWIKGEEIEYLIKRYVEIKKKELEVMDKLLEEYGLDEEDIKKFEKFREELWKRERKKFI